MTEKLVRKILDDLNNCRDVVLAAQDLVNEVYASNAKLLDGLKKRSYFSSKEKKFIQKINDSVLTKKEKSDFNRLDKKEVYKLAREIILELIKKEIKNPLA